MRFKATYYCGYSGTDDVHYLIADSENDVAVYMDDGLYDYAETWTHLAFGWDNSYTEDEFDEFFGDCGFRIEEITEDELAEFEEDEGISEDDWEDITN